MNMSLEFAAFGRMLKTSTTTLSILIRYLLHFKIMFLNKVMLYGNLTRDPELRSMPSGINIAKLSLATNRTYKDKDGKKVEQTEFHSVSVFGRTADLVAQYLKKGSSAYIEGRLQTSSWDDKKTGEKKYRTEVVAENVQFGPRSSGGGGAGGGTTDSAPRSAPNPRASNDEENFDEGPAAGPGIAYPKEEINPDDIPF